jgi:signal transduction histidine kinase
MDKKTLAQVFRPFFTTKTRSRGTGLGLTMVRSVVQQRGGEVEIESELGKGTRVTIRMPRIEVSGESN